MRDSPARHNAAKLITIQLGHWARSTGAPTLMFDSRPVAARYPDRLKR